MLSKMKVVLLLTLTLVGLGVADPKTANAYKEHMRRVNEFPCKEPQKRVIPVSSLKNLPSDEYYTPDVTVLYRCDRGAGSCSQGVSYGCGPAETEEVSLVFLVRKTLPQGKRRRDNNVRFEHETITALNHTMCECQLLSNMPK